MHGAGLAAAAAVPAVPEALLRAAPGRLRPQRLILGELQRFLRAGPLAKPRGCFMRPGWCCGAAPWPSPLKLGSCPRWVLGVLAAGLHAWLRVLWVLFGSRSSQKEML